MPVSLEDQASESQQQLKDVRASLINSSVAPICAYYSVSNAFCNRSESRRANAILRASNLDDHLAMILKANGDESKYFPQDLKTLFGYDSMSALLVYAEGITHTCIPTKMTQRRLL